MIQDPWDLITLPTLLDKPISPNKKSILFLGLFGGFIISSIYALIRERKNDLVYSRATMQSLINENLLIDLTLQRKNKQKESIELLCKRLEQDEQFNSISIIPLCNSLDKSFKDFVSEIRSLNSGIKVNILNDLKDVKNDTHHILVASLGFSKSEEIISLRKRLNLYRNNISGWILINK